MQLIHDVNHISQLTRMKSAWPQISGHTTDNLIFQGTVTSNGFGLEQEVKLMHSAERVLRMILKYVYASFKKKFH